ncbi:unnamed protein product, partial [Didymodactylos carnosus]
MTPKYDKGIGDKLQGYGLGSMPLKLGCVAVLNRTQEEIEQNISFDEMRKRENDFFSNTRAFENVPDCYKGSDQLVKKLATLQQNRIRSTLPSVIEQLRIQIRTKQDELDALPASLSTEAECLSKFSALMKEYRESILARVNGIYDHDLSMIIENK